MAKAGTFAAYKELQPNQKDLSQDLKYWNDVDARQKEQDFREDQAAQAKQERDNVRKDKLRDAYGKFIVSDKTGLRSLDANITNFVGVDVMGKQQELLSEFLDTDPYSRRGIELQTKLQGIASVPKQLKDVNDYFTADMTTYNEAVKAGTAWRDPKREQMYAEKFENAVIMLDDNMRVVVGFADTDGDGKITIKDETFHYDDLRKDFPQNELIERYDIPEVIQGLFKDKMIPMSDKTTVPRFGESLQIKGVDDEKLESLSEGRYYNEIRRDDDGNIIEATPSPQAISHMIEMGLDIEDPNNIEQARQNFEGQIRNSVSDINKRTENASAKIRASQLADERKRDQTTTATPINSTQENWKDKYDVLDRDNYNTVPLLGNRVVGTLRGEDENFTNAKVTGFTFDKNDKVVVTAEVPRTKQTTQKDISELQKRVDEAETDEEKYVANEALSEAKGAGTITIPGQSEQVQITLPNERVEEATGMTKEQAKQRAKKSGTTATDDPLGIM